MNNRKIFLTVAITVAALLALVGAIVLVDISLAKDVTVIEEEIPRLDPDALNILGKKTDLAKPYMTKIFDLYSKTTGEKLNIMSVDDAKYETIALNMLKDGQMADVFMHFHNADLEMYNAAENFLDLKDETWISDLTDSAKAYCTDAEGAIWGLPFWESSVSGCYYNKTLFDDLGLDVPTNQEEFDNLCEFLSQQGIKPICWAANGCSWMPQFGLDPVFADDGELLERLNRNEVTYADIPAVTNMIEWIRKAQRRGWFGDNYASVGWDEISGELNSGTVAMTFIWDTWFYTDFVEGEYTKEDFALMPIFMGTADRGTYEGGNLNMMMVNKNSERQEQALEFLRFCATPDNYNKAFEGISTVSVFKGQTTNIQSKMVTDAARSIARLERVSTASTKIIGYNAEHVVDAINAMFAGLSVKDCIARMDAARIEEAREIGAEGF